MSGILPTVIYPSTVADFNQRLLAAASGTDASVKACGDKLDAQTKTSWALFFAAVSSFAQEDPGYLGLGSRMDRAESYGSELAAWQDKLSKACPLGLPTFNPTSATTDINKMLQYVAWTVGAFAFAYGVGKIADVVVPLLPAKRRHA